MVVVFAPVDKVTEGTVAAGSEDEGDEVNA